MEAQIQIVEEGKRLSECLLWKLQEDFYATAGLAAWNNVPYYPTSNAFIGEAYADLILNFLHDYGDALDFSEPFYIIELAAGSGGLAFYVLKELRHKLAYFEKFKALKLCYVMTDFADSIVQGWLKNDQFKPFMEAGLMDVAVFRPEDQTEIHLTLANRTLNSATIKNPILAVANYFFDSIRQDQFRVSNHQLHETRLTFTRKLNGITPDSPPHLDQLTVTESFTPVAADYYADERLNRVLQYYAHSFEDASIIFPLGGFHCIQNLLRLSGERMMLITADKGFTNPDYMRGHKEQPYTSHEGAFSYMVNFHAIGKYFELQDGFAFLDRGNTSILDVMMGGVLSGFGGTLEKTRYYFEENLSKKDSANAINLARRLAKPELYDGVALLRAGLALIQAGNYDPLLLHECEGHILNGIGESLLITDYRNLVATLAGVWQNMFVASNRLNVYHVLERIYLRIRHYDDCRKAAQESLARFGPTFTSLFHLARSLEFLNQPAEALAHYRQAARLDPESPLVQEALARLHS